METFQNTVEKYYVDEFTALVDILSTPLSDWLLLLDPSEYFWSNESYIPELTVESTVLPPLCDTSLVRYML